MARRTPWVGRGPKPIHKTNDCVVLSFKKDFLAARALHSLNQSPEDSEGYKFAPLVIFTLQSSLGGTLDWRGMATDGLMHMQICRINKQSLTI